MRDSQNIPPVPMMLPAIISGRAPIRLTSWDAIKEATRSRSRPRRASRT
jgi:hypothetical protein